jgi:hypothetical protein
METYDEPGWSKPDPDSGISTPCGRLTAIAANGSQAHGILEHADVVDVVELELVRLKGSDGFNRPRWVVRTIHSTHPKAERSLAVLECIGHAYVAAILADANELTKLLA